MEPMFGGSADASKGHDDWAVSHLDVVQAALSKMGTGQVCGTVFADEPAEFYKEVVDPQNGQEAFDLLKAVADPTAALPAGLSLRRSSRAANKPARFRTNAEPEQAASVRQRPPKHKAAEVIQIVELECSDSEAASDTEDTDGGEESVTSTDDSESSDEDMQKHTDPYHDGDADEECD